MGLFESSPSSDQPCDPGIDPIGKPPSVNPVHRTHTKDSHPKPVSDHALTPSRTRLSSPLVTAREQQPWCAPTRMWLTLSENPAKNHQEPDSSKQARASIPPPNATRSRVRAMSQDYSTHWPQSGGQPAHLSLLPSTGSGKPALKHLFQEPLFFFFFLYI